MGVNFPDVKFVIHIGPARSTVDHIQGMGMGIRLIAIHKELLTYLVSILRLFEKN